MTKKVANLPTNQASKSPQRKLTNLQRLWASIDQIEKQSNKPYADPSKRKFWGLVLYSQQFSADEVKERVSEEVLAEVNNNVSGVSTTYFEVYVHVPEITGVLPEVDTDAFRKIYKSDKGVTATCIAFNKQLKKIKMYPTFYASSKLGPHPSPGSVCKVQFLDDSNMCYGIYHGAVNASAAKKK